MSDSKRLLESLAEQTWKRIKHSEKFEISQGEETISDILLLEIMMSGLNSIKHVDKCPKKLEAKRGIDWEWWIGSYRFGWIKYAIQAKKIALKPKLAAGTYNKLNHQIGHKKTQPRKRQIDVLKKYAGDNRLVPLYCFYNYIELDRASFFRYWHCGEKLDPQQLGCSITPLKNVEFAIENRGKRTFEALHSKIETLPWRCIVSHPHVLDLYDMHSRLSARNSRNATQSDFDSRLFGKTTVHNLPEGQLESSFNVFRETRLGAKRLVVFDIDKIIGTYIENKDRSQASSDRFEPDLDSLE